MSNAQLGLTGQSIIPTASSQRTRASDTFALQADQVEAQLNGDSQAHSRQEDGSATDLAESSEQDADADSAEDLSADDLADVSNGAEASAAQPELNDADQELLASMGHVQGILLLAQCMRCIAHMVYARQKKTSHAVRFHSGNLWPGLL